MDRINFETIAFLGKFLNKTHQFFQIFFNELNANWSSKLFFYHIIQKSWFFYYNRILKDSTFFRHFENFVWIYFGKKITTNYWYIKEECLQEYLSKQDSQISSRIESIFLVEIACCRNFIKTITKHVLNGTVYRCCRIAKI